MARTGTSTVRSEEPRDAGLTAAASPVSLDGTTWRSWKLGDSRWQMEAWRHFDICGELRFASNWMGNAVSRARLYISELDKYGRPSKETSDPAIQVLAETMFGGPALKAEAQRALGIQLYVTGESYIIAEDVAQASKDVWYICSTSEVHRNGTDRVLVDRSNIYGGGQHQMRKGRDLMMRVWTPHPRRYDAADASVRAVLPILREIEGLTKKVFAQIDSRLAGAGLLFLPQELDFPRTDKDPPGARGLMALLQRNIAAALNDQSAASALVPVMAQVPGELIDKIKWQTFETPFQAETGTKLVEAIRRLATGLDIPPEVLLGQGDTNHWSAWQIEESTIKIQIEPLLVRICDALTGGYLKAALTAIGKNPDDYVVWYDTAALAVRPNRQADAIALYGLGDDVISTEEVRKAGDWGEGAAPSKKEYEKRLAEKMVALNPGLISNADIQKALGIKWKIDDPNAAPPPGDQGAAPADPNAQPDAWPQQPADQGNDQRALPQQADTGMEAALLVGADLIVKRALERAGARLLNRARRTSGEFANVPAMQLHAHIPVGPDEIGRILGDAFDEQAEELADRVGMDPIVVTDMLTVYTTSLVVQGELHDFAKFSLYVDRALDLIGHAQCAQFCRNPLHPGPCKGWKTKQGTPSVPAKATPAAPSKPSAAPAKKAAKAAKAVKAAPGAPIAPTPSQQVAAGDFTSLKRIGPQGGSNPGGVFQAPDGRRFYVKAATSEQWAREQAATAELYRAAGVSTPAITVGGGTPGLPAGFHTATEIVDGLTPAGSTPAQKKKFGAELRAGFAVDAWLADWDIGQHGNAMAQSDGSPMRMDIGGSLRFRARGGPKGAAFGTTVGEWSTMRDPNNVSGPLFSGITDQELIDSAAKVSALDDATIKSIVKSHGLDAALATTLIKRRDDITAKAAAIQARLSAKPVTGAQDHIAVDGGVSLSSKIASMHKAGKMPVARDPFLRAVADEQGFSNPPTLASSVAVGKLGTAGTHEVIYRGVTPARGKTAKDIHDEMRTGEAQYGHGIYGNGYYFTTNRSTASQYAGGRSAGSVARAAISKDAKITDYKAIYAEWRALMSGLPSNDPRRTVFSDVGAYAAARGFDAIEVPQGQRVQGRRVETYFIILNRSVMVVAK